MSITAEITRKYIAKEHYTLFGGVVGSSGGSSSGGGETNSSIPARHWEVATLTELSGKLISVVFALPFEETPVGKLDIYRMVYQNGAWVKQNVLLTSTKEEVVSKFGFDFSISDYENLTGVIIKYMFTEGDLIEGGGIVTPPVINLLTNLVALYDFEDAGSTLVDSHGSNNGVNTNINVVTSSILSKAYKYNDSEAKTIVPSTTALELDGYTDSYSISIWVNRGEEETWKPFNLITKNTRGKAYPNSFLFEVVNAAGDIKLSVTDGTNIDSILLNGALYDEDWVHIIMIVDNTNSLLKAYLNGQQITQIALTLTGTTIDTYKDMGIMVAPTNTSPAENDSILITRLGIWKKVLTDNEINALFNLGTGKAFDTF